MLLLLKDYHPTSDTLTATSLLPSLPFSILRPFLPHPQIMDLVYTSKLIIVEHLSIGSAVATSLILNDQLYTWCVFSLAFPEKSK